MNRNVLNCVFVFLFQNLKYLNYEILSNWAIKCKNAQKQSKQGVNKLHGIFKNAFSVKLGFL